MADRPCSSCSDPGKLSTSGSSTVAQTLLHEQLLGKRLYIQAWVRFLVVAGIIVGVFGAEFIVGVENLDIPATVGLAIALGVFNLGAFAAARRFRDDEKGAAANPFVELLMHVTISVDFIFLTVGLWLVGGPKSPLLGFYLVHVFLAAILLSPRSAYLHALFGYILLAGLVLGEWSGIIPARFPLGAVNDAEPLDGRFMVAVLATQAFLMGLTTFLGTGLAQLLRQGEQRLLTVNAECERMSNMHRDFFHIAMHDLKAPVSAATMLLDGLNAGDQLSPEQRQWLGRVGHRLNEVTTFLGDLEVLAAVESADLSKGAELVDIPELLAQVVDRHREHAANKNHTVHLEHPSSLPPVRAVPRLIHEAVANLLSNAIKYTPDNGTITVRARQNGRRMRIEVEDNGIGIDDEDQERLFEEFSRVRRENTALGKVSGTGLGLSIVRRIVAMHNGRVGLTSTRDEGSTFYIDLPVESTAPREEE